MIYAVDFDGTLYLGSTPFPTVDVQKMNMPLIRTLQCIQKDRPDDKFILWTCRDGEKELKPAIEAISSVSNLRWDAINDNIEEVKASFGNCRKIIADFYIDDRSILPFVFINTYD